MQLSSLLGKRTSDMEGEGEQSMTRIQKCGLPPGTLMHIGQRKMEEAHISVIDFSDTELHEVVLQDIEDVRAYRDKDSVTWINVDGLHDTEIIRKLGELYDLHDLVLEDILHTDQRPKVDAHDDYIYVVLKMLNYSEQKDIFESEQLSLVFGDNFVITFQEEPGDVFDVIRERIRKGYKVRHKGADYLAYSLMDLVVDTYFHTLERMGEWIEDLENEIGTTATKKTTTKINDLKRDLTFLRRNIWPVREVMTSLQRQETIITHETNIFLKDVYDHVVQAIDNLEMYRDMVSNLMDLYLSNLSYKMNEVMRTLTVVTTIFIPLTFITSVYGMNFSFMPELQTRYGYFVVMGLLLVLGLLMLRYFQRKKWL